MMLSEFDEKVPALFDSEMGSMWNRKENHSGEMRDVTFLLRSSAGVKGFGFALVVRCGHLAGEVYGLRIQSP